MKKTKEKIAERFFQSPRLEISRILIEELTHWKRADKPSDEEFFRLVDRLSKLKLNY